jgi:hypothetical protein
MEARMTGKLIGVVTAVLLVSAAPIAGRQAEDLASVQIPRRVLANGQALASGTYTVRLTTAAVAPVTGQSAAGAKWVEFVQNGQTRGRELATVLSADEARDVVEGALPAAGAAKVEMLKGNDYLRIWINHGGTHYLVHLAVPSGG